MLERGVALVNIDVNKREPEKRNAEPRRRGPQKICCDRLTINQTTEEMEMEMEIMEAPPILSTPAEHILEGSSTLIPSSGSTLSEELLYVQYEIQRTIKEIRDGRWKRIALQFPDDMLVDAPRVFERLRDGLKSQRIAASTQTNQPTVPDGALDVAEKLEATSLTRAQESTSDQAAEDGTVEKLTILADTSYGACCVDEVAAEHVDAEVVVHYGRSCLSPTARLPVIYVYTSQSLDLDSAATSFKDTYPSKDVRVVLVADIPYTHHISQLYERLKADGYENLFATDVIRDPSSLLPNRTVPSDVQDDPDKLKEYSIFHISNPPTSLLLSLSSRVKRIHILPTNVPTSAGPLEEATSTASLRRRYALVTRLPAIPILGILINTLSVANYMSALQHCQTLISRAGKKSYTFVVGKVNPAKLANFAEIGVWVVIGCWENSLIESKEFLAPIVTPFELEVGLMGDEGRQWGGEWVANFQEVVERARKEGEGVDVQAEGVRERWWDEEESDDEPPDFDLRTGRYVSRSRPMGRPRVSGEASLNPGGEVVPAAPPSSALVQRAKGDVAVINGAVSPAAEFLRSKRTWQGLGSDYEVVYERDDEGRIRGAGIEEGRQGVAKEYVVRGAGEG
jgi:diphthamide biosynthesis protein 2